MRPVKRAAVGEHGRIVRHLKRRYQNIALADGQMISVADIPLFALGFFFPSGRGQKARGLAGQINAGLRVQAEQSLIFGH